MNILILDIETSPNLGWFWRVWKEDIAPSQLRQATEVMCFSAKWQGENRVMFYGTNTMSKREMIGHAHRLLDEADAVMTYNGISFDIKHLNREIALAKLKPPSPYQHIDLFKVVKKNFQFPYYRLDYVSKEFGLSGKVKHEGFQLWLDCMKGDPKAWARMTRYNKQDVVLLEELYVILMPWIANHPSHAAIRGATVCNRCGSSDLQPRGYRYTATGRFQRFVCRECGGWCSSTKREASTPIVGLAA